jgi:large subunit ribosomal protein L3
MALGLLGEKIGMTQWFDEDGRARPVTVVRIEPNTVVQVKSEETDGYNALQIGFRPTKEERVRKPQQGHFKKAGAEMLKVLREFRVDDVEAYEAGQKLTVEVFEAGEKVNVRGRSKGHGTTGAIKRWGFLSGQQSHGHSEDHRKLKSIGTMRATGKIFKGKKMHGHMGDAKKMVKALEILKVDTENNLIVLRGSVPGAKFGVLELIKRG